uniref:Uncharacterized protein n=1 Tax=Alexandrium monilatum TaxID=311494 RepID=A0A7S4UH54_9DINO
MAEAASDDEADPDNPGALRWDEAYRIAHRCAGVIEDIRSSPIPPERKEELLSQTEDVLGIAASSVDRAARAVAADSGAPAATEGRPPGGRTVVVESEPLGPPERPRAAQTRRRTGGGAAKVGGPARGGEPRCETSACEDGHRGAAEDGLRGGASPRVAEDGSCREESSKAAEEVSCREASPGATDDIWYGAAEDECRGDASARAAEDNRIADDGSRREIPLRAAEDGTSEAAGLDAMD